MILIQSRLVDRWIPQCAGLSPKGSDIYMLYTDTIPCNTISRYLAQGAHILLDWVATETQSSAHARLGSRGAHEDSCAGALLVLK